MLPKVAGLKTEFLDATIGYDTLHSRSQVPDPERDQGNSLPCEAGEGWGGGRKRIPIRSKKPDPSLDFLCVLCVLCVLCASVLGLAGELQRSPGVTLPPPTLAT
jgi:hypothetical protein